MEESRTSIKIKESTKKALDKEGIFRETYDDVISRLLKKENIDKATRKASYESKVWGLKDEQDFTRWLPWINDRFTR